MQSTPLRAEVSRNTTISHEKGGKKCGRRLSVSGAVTLLPLLLQSQIKVLLPLPRAVRLVVFLPHDPLIQSLFPKVAYPRRAISPATALQQAIVTIPASRRTFSRDMTRHPRRRTVQTQRLALIKVRTPVPRIQTRWRQR